MKKLKASHVAIFGIGGVGGYVAEALARVIRQECKKRGIKDVKVVYSKEKPVIRDTVPASCAFVPSVAGLIIASQVIKDLLK